MFNHLFNTYETVQPPPSKSDKYYEQDIYQKPDLDLNIFDILGLNIKSKEVDKPSDQSIVTLEPIEFLDVISPFELSFKEPEKVSKTVPESVIKADTKDGKFNTLESFARTLNSAYRKVLKKRGLDPNYSYILTAAVSLESGWGQHLGGTFNYGGVKAKKGESGNSALTTDYVNGKYVKRYSTFRNYDSIEDYCDRVITLLSNKRYNAFNQYSASEPFKLWRHVLDKGYGGGDVTGKDRYMDTVQKNYRDIKRMTKSTMQSLTHIDIEDLLKQEGITSVNGKKIKFGNKGIRPANAGYGSKNSHHKERDPHTGNANARDISIVGGTDQDYAEFRRMLLLNDKIRTWFALKGWGIINELTPAVMNKTRATGRHFHFGPDRWAVRTWQGWLDNPNVSITKVF